MEKPVEKTAKKVNTRKGVLVLIASIIAIALLFGWTMYERSRGADSKQSLAVVSDKISKLEKDVETCLSMSKERETKVAVQAPCEKPKKKVARREAKKFLAPPPAKQVVTPPAPVLETAPVARPVVAEATKPATQHVSTPVAEAKLLDGVDPDFGKTKEHESETLVVEEDETQSRKAVKQRTRRVVIMEQPAPYYDGGYVPGYVQAYPQYQYAPAPPIFVPPYVPPPQQHFYPAPHVIVPAPSSHVVHPGGHTPSGVTSGHAPSGSTGGAH